MCGDLDVCLDQEVCSRRTCTSRFHDGRVRSEIWKVFGGRWVERGESVWMMERMCMQAVCLSRVVVEVDHRDHTRPLALLGRFSASLCLYLSTSPDLVRFACLVVMLLAAGDHGLERQYPLNNPSCFLGFAQCIHASAVGRSTSVNLYSPPWLCRTNAIMFVHGTQAISHAGAV